MQFKEIILILLSVFAFDTFADSHNSPIQDIKTLGEQAQLARPNEIKNGMIYMIQAQKLQANSCRIDYNYNFLFVDFST